MKNWCLFLILIGICLSNFSCTVLQWRKTDTEIQEFFKSQNIASTISYYKIDSLDVNVRLQSITSNKKQVNLVFIHGAPSSLSTWESYLKDSTLIATTNMHAIDRPGYGYSNFGNEIASINEQAKIISSIITRKKLKHIIAIGSSYGGPLAARVAILNKNIKAVVMISPAIDPTKEKDVWGSRLTQWKLTRWLVPTAYRVAGDEKTAHAKELAVIENDWNNLNIPVLHIHGDHDAIVPYENIHFSKTHFKNLEVITFPNKGHEISWKNSDSIIPHIIKLIDKIK